MARKTGSDLAARRAAALDEAEALLPLKFYREEARTRFLLEMFSTVEIEVMVRQLRERPDDLSYPLGDDLDPL